MPAYPSIYRFRALAVAMMVNVSTYLFSASLSMDALKNYEVLADVYPENINDYASRLTAEEKFQGESLQQLIDKIYLERYSIYALILALAIFFLPSPVAVERSRVPLAFLYSTTPASIVFSEVLATFLSLDRILYPAWRDNIVVSWFISCTVVFAICFILLPLLILDWQGTSGGLISCNKAIQVLSGVPLAVWLVGFTRSFFNGDYEAMLPLWLGFVFFYYVLPSSDEKTPVNRQVFRGLLERISSA